MSEELYCHKKNHSKEQQNRELMTRSGSRKFWWGDEILKPPYKISCLESSNSDLSYLS